MPMRQRLGSRPARQLAVARGAMAGLRGRDTVGRSSDPKPRNGKVGLSISAGQDGTPPDAISSVTSDQCMSLDDTYVICRRGPASLEALWHVLHLAAGHRPPDIAQHQ